MTNFYPGGPWARLNILLNRRGTRRQVRCYGWRRSQLTRRGDCRMGCHRGCRGNAAKHKCTDDKRSQGPGQWTTVTGTNKKSPECDQTGQKAWLVLHPHPLGDRIGRLEKISTTFSGITTMKHKNKTAGHFKNKQSK